MNEHALKNPYVSDGLLTNVVALRVFASENFDIPECGLEISYWEKRCFRLHFFRVTSSLLRRPARVIGCSFSLPPPYPAFLLEGLALLVMIA